jgi:hypothetical protein
LRFPAPGSEFHEPTQGFEADKNGKQRIFIRLNHWENKTGLGVQGRNIFEGTLSMKWFKWFWEGLNTPLVNESGDRRRHGAHEGAGNFSPRAQQVLALARREADRFSHNFVGTEHLLLGLIRLGQGVAVNVLGKMGLDLESVRTEVEKQIGTGPDQKMFGNIPYTPRVKKVLSLAAKEARALNHTYVGTEHILLGLLREGDGVAARVLANLGVNTEVTRQLILKELDPNFSSAPDSAALPQESESQEPQREAIDTGKRYDVYCHEGDREVVYRNARFKRRRTLFKKREYDFFSEYMEIEQADGSAIFISGSSVIKFCEHGTTPASEIIPGKGPQV